MKKYIFIGIGGFLGAISRYFIMNVHLYNYQEGIPLNTLIINVIGSFMIALILTVALEIWEIDEALRLGIATGFIGAFTTFSTLCKETVNLIASGYYYSAISYMTMSAVLGLSAVYFGVVVARELITKILKKHKNSEDNDHNEITDEVI
jgi:fluoride exporter